MLERVGIAHVPLRIDLGVWNQNFIAQYDTNEVRLAVDYIRVFQPQNHYVDMEPVYQ